MRLSTGRRKGAGALIAGSVAASVFVALLLGVTPAAAVVNVPDGGSRIVNGDDTGDGQYGFVAALLAVDRLEIDGIYQSQFCAGTLTTATTVVTAAHCVIDPGSGVAALPDQILVGIGRSLRSDALRQVPIASIHVHPGYLPLVWRNDIAVVTLAEPVDGVPALMPLQPFEHGLYAAAGTPATVLGWGNAAKGGNAFPEDLRAGHLVIFPDRACSREGRYQIGEVGFTGYAPADADRATMLCASGVNGSGAIIDSCQGDSGGPLVVGSGAAFRLVGIVSWGDDCASRHPGVYTRVSAMTDFLAAHGAIDLRPPSAAPLIVTQAVSTSIRVTFTPTPGESGVETFAATATDAAGATFACFAKPRKDGGPASCSIGGLVNGTSYSVSAISANPGGNSPAASPIAVTPVAAPLPAR